MNVNWFMQHISYDILRDCVFISTSTSIEYLNFFLFFSSSRFFLGVSATRRAMHLFYWNCNVKEKRNKNQVMNALRCFSFTHLAVFYFYFIAIVNILHVNLETETRKRDVLNVAKCRINLLRVLGFFFLRSSGEYTITVECKKNA
jgi:hypothetical protein